MQSIKLQHWLLGIFAGFFMLNILVCCTNYQIESPLKGNVEINNTSFERSDDFKKMLMPIADIASSDLLLDISMNTTNHIKGSVVIPYTQFVLSKGHFKPVPEICRILGAAGINQRDRVVIYGECLSCGGGPAPATYIYWIMKYLGHKEVWVLDGNVEDWAGAGLPTTNESVVRPRTNYTPDLNIDSFATYEYIRDGGAQIVDARLSQEFKRGTIPGAISISYEGVLDGHLIKNETSLREVFTNLSRDRPVVVFTDTGIKGSVVWFSLSLLGYNAKLYSWANWLENQQIEANAAVSKDDIEALGL